MKKNRIKHSILYIFFEGISKGGNTLIFLLASSILTKVEYVNLLSLFSLEGLLIILSPFYYTDVLYKLRDNFSSDTIKNNSAKVIFLYSILLLILGFLFFSFLKDLYSVSSFEVVFYIVLIVLFRLFYQVESVNNQIEEEHKRAIKLKAIPFLLSSVLGIIFFISFDDKIVSFFLGRSVGFVIAFIFDFFRGTFRGINFVFNYDFLKGFFRRSFNLIIVGIGGWFLGYGMLNVLKNYYSTDVNYEIGLMLNIWSVFLLLANGINGVYLPMFRKLYIESVRRANKLFNKVFALYLGIIIMSFVFFVFLRNIPVLSNEYKIYLNVFSYVIFIFLAQVLQYLSIPYFIVQDRFKTIAQISFLTNLVSVVLIYFHHFYENIFSVEIIRIIVFCYYIRSLPLFLLRNNKDVKV